jgi:hypothetical protein
MNTHRCSAHGAPETLCIKMRLSKIPAQMSAFGANTVNAAFHSAHRVSS